jgi:hypothetical protein
MIFIGKLSIFVHSIIEFLERPDKILAKYGNPIHTSYGRG